MPYGGKLYHGRTGAAKFKPNPALNCLRIQLVSNAPDDEFPNAVSPMNPEKLSSPLKTITSVL